MSDGTIQSLGIVAVIIVWIICNAVVRAVSAKEYKKIRDAEMKKACDLVSRMKDWMNTIRPEGALFYTRYVLLVEADSLIKAQTGREDA